MYKSLHVTISYMNIYYYFNKLFDWQVNTQIGDARVCEIARTYLQLDLNAILHQHLIFSSKWTSESDFGERNISEQSTSVWLHDQKFLRTKWKFIAGEENVHQREITWYWDPVKEVVWNQIFDSDAEWGAKIQSRSRKTPYTAVGNLLIGSVIHTLCFFNETN